MSEDVLFEKRADGVGLITLNRPDSLNAMGGRLIPMLAELLEECERDRSVRCVALTGTGRGFCAGGDIRGMQSRNDAQVTLREEAEDGPARLMTTFNRLVDELRVSHRQTSLKLHTMSKP